METRGRSGELTAYIRNAQLATWDSVAGHFGRYELLLPGQPSFVCLASECPAHCCRKYSVSLGEAEVERMTRASGLAPLHFLECEDGEPIALALAQPYLLARRDGACALLGPDLLCGQYEGRPDACRQYPHHVLFIDRDESKPVYGDLARMAQAMAWLEPKPAIEPKCMPLLVRHLDCPGFEGPPLSYADWLVLMHETTYLQYAQLRPDIASAAHAGVLDSNHGEG